MSVDKKAGELYDWWITALSSCCISYL